MPRELSPFVEDGLVRLCLALRATLYFRDGGTAPARRKLVTWLERYLKASAGALKWGADPDSGMPKKLSGAGARAIVPKTWLDRLGAEEWNMVFHGGTKMEDASPWMFEAVAFKGYAPGEPSYVTFSLPLSWLQGKGPEGFVRLVLDACAVLQPIHGYAGLGIVLHVAESGAGRVMPRAEGLAFRFHGLEVDFPKSHVMYLANAIKGVNWLTVLADSWFEKLGGREKLAAALGDGFVFHDFPGGAVIQAGPHPVFGDVNRKEDLPHYRKLARALRPIRVEYRDSMATLTGGAFSIERTREWFERLDR